RAEPTLQSVMLMEIPAERRHHRVAGEPFDGLDGAVVAGDREHQARAGRFAVYEDRARAAHAVLAAEMRPGQIAALAQKISERQARRHLIGNDIPVDAQTDRRHISTCWTARIAATA